MLKNILSPLASLLIFLIIAHQYNIEWLVWIAILVFGVILINELHYQQTAPGDAIITGLNLITQKLDDIMNKQERLDKVVADLKGATDDIAADLQVLKDQIAAGNISEESLAALETNIEVLKAIGTAQ